MKDRDTLRLRVATLTAQIKQIVGNDRLLSSLTTTNTVVNPDTAGVFGVAPSSVVRFKLADGLEVDVYVDLHGKLRIDGTGSIALELGDANGFTVAVLPERED
jgi:hypothetical protein